MRAYPTTVELAHQARRRFGAPSGAARAQQPPPLALSGLQPYATPSLMPGDGQLALTQYGRFVGSSAFGESRLFLIDDGSILWTPCRCSGHLFSPQGDVTWRQSLGGNDAVVGASSVVIAEGPAGVPRVYATSTTGLFAVQDAC